MSVNDDLLDAFVRNAVVLERFAAGEADQVALFLGTEVFPDLRAKIESSVASLKSRGLPKTATLKRLEELDRRLVSSIRAATTKMTGNLSMNLEALGASQSEFVAKTLAKMVPLDDFDFKTISPEFLRSIVTDFPVSGRTIAQRFEDLGTSLSTKALTQVRIGLAQGETTSQIVARLSNKGLASTKAQAQAIARTAVNHSATAAREQTYAENSDVIKAVEIVATLDSRTTEICMNYDGKVFPINEGPRPPFHFNCRTTTVPVTKGYEEFAPGLQAKIPEGKRASMTGEVPAKITYGDWLKKQTKAIQDETLGPARAQLFRDGKIGIQDLIGKFGKPLNLQQLQKKLDVKEQPPTRIDPPATEPIDFPTPLVNRPEPPTPPVATIEAVIPTMVDVAEDWPAELQTWLVQAMDAKLKGKGGKASYWKNKGNPLGLPKKWQLPDSWEGLNAVLSAPFSDIAEKLVIKDFDKLEKIFEKHVIAAAENNSGSKSYYKTAAKKLNYTGEMPLSLEDIQAIIPAVKTGASSSGIKPINLPSTKEKLKEISAKYGEAVLSGSSQMKTYYKNKAKKLGYVGPLEGDPGYKIMAIEAWEPDAIVTPVAPEIPGFEAPKKISLPPIQYDEIVQDTIDKLDSPTGWHELSDKAKDTIERLAAAETTKDVLRVFEDAYPDSIGQIKLPRRKLSPDVLRAILSRHIEFFDHLPEYLAAGEVRIPHMNSLTFPDATRVRGVKRNTPAWVYQSGGRMEWNIRLWDEDVVDSTRASYRYTAKGYAADGQERPSMVYGETWSVEDGMTVHEYGHVFQGQGQAFHPGEYDSAKFSKIADALGPRIDDIVAARPIGYRAISDAFEEFRKEVFEVFDQKSQAVRSAPRSGKRRWTQTNYARTNTSEAWAESWAKIVLEDPDEWDEVTRFCWSKIVKSHEEKGVPLPSFFRKKAASSAPEGYLDVAKWEKIGNQKGSNEGGLYVNPDTGEKFYVKFYADADHVDNEIVANRLYREMGLNTTKVHHGYANGRYAVVSEWQEGLQQIDFDADDVWTKTRAVEGFATDAWLANWDVAGATFDNLLAQGSGPIRVDAGGSLLFRAQGKPKGSLFGDEVVELKTLLDPYKAPQAAKVYGGMGDTDIIQSISALESIAEERIDEIVDSYWRAGSSDLKDELKRKLKTRRNNLLSQRDKLLEKAEEDFKLALKLRKARESGELLTPEQYELAQKRWIDSLPKAQRDAIQAFTGSTYTEMKRYQRGEYPNAPDSIIKKANDMTQALANAPSFQGDLYRGMRAGGTEGWFAPFLQEGGRLRIRDLTSTSYKKGSQFSGNVQLYFENSTRSAGRVNEISGYKDREFEAVIRPDSDFIVEEVIFIDAGQRKPSNLPRWAEDQYDKLGGVQMEKRWLIRLREA